MSADQEGYPAPRRLWEVALTENVCIGPPRRKKAPTKPKIGACRYPAMDARDAFLAGLGVRLEDLAQFMNLDLDSADDGGSLSISELIVVGICGLSKVLESLA